MSIETTDQLDSPNNGCDNQSFLDYLGYNSDELMRDGIPTDESVVTVRSAEILINENRGTIKKIDVPNSDSLFTRFRKAAQDLCDREYNDSVDIDSTPNELDIMACNNISKTYLEAKHANNKTNYNLREIIGQLSECPTEDKLSENDMIAVSVPITQIESLADAWTETNNKIGITMEGIVEILDKNQIKFVVYGITHNRYVKIDVKYLLDMYGNWC